MAHAETLGAFIEAAHALASLHARGQVHGAISLDSVHTRSDGRVILRGPATPDRESPYAAPEVRAGRDATAASDRFALCLALYEALFRVRPFDDAQARALHLSEGTVPWPSARPEPAGLREVLCRGLAADPAQRFEDTAELTRALIRASAGRGRWRRVRSMAPLAALGLGAAALLWWAYGRDCDAAAALVRDEYATAARASLLQAFARSGRSYATRVASQVDLLLTRLVVDAALGARARCRTGETTDACADHRLDALRATLRVLMTADGVVVDHAGRALRELAAGDEEVCDPTAPRSEALARVRALRRLGQALPAAESAEQLVVKARAAGLSRLEAEALLELGLARASLGGAAPTADALFAAARLAELIDLPRLGREAHAALARHFMASPGGLGQARLFSSSFEELRARPLGGGDDAALAAQLSSALALAERDLPASRTAARLALELARRRHGWLSDGASEAAAHLALTLSESGLHEQAVEARRSALVTGELLDGPDHPATAQRALELARALSATGDLPGAARHAEEASQSLLRGLGEAERESAEAMLLVGELMLLDGRPEPAASVLERATTMLSHAERERSGRIARALWAVALARVGQGERALEEAHAADSPPAIEPWAYTVPLSLGTVLLERRDAARALEPLSRALRLLDERPGEGPTRAHASHLLARALRESKQDLSEALTLAREALASLTQEPGPYASSLPALRDLVAALGRESGLAVQLPN